MRYSGRGLAPVTLAEDAIQHAVFDNIRVRGAAGVFAFHPRNGSRGQRSLAGINKTASAS
jgi:hypothetical protein